MAPDLEQIADDAMDRQKALRLGGRFEPILADSLIRLCREPIVTVEPTENGHLDYPPGRSGRFGGSSTGWRSP